MRRFVLRIEREPAPKRAVIACALEINPVKRVIVKLQIIQKLFAKLFEINLRGFFRFTAIEKCMENIPVFLPIGKPITLADGIVFQPRQKLGGQMPEIIQILGANFPLYFFDRFFADVCAVEHLSGNFGAQQINRLKPLAATVFVINHFDRRFGKPVDGGK